MTQKRNTSLEQSGDSITHYVNAILEDLTKIKEGQNVEINTGYYTDHRQLLMIQVDHFLDAADKVFHERTNTPG